MISVKQLMYRGVERVRSMVVHFVILLESFPLILKMAGRNILRQKKRSLIVASTAAIGLFSVTMSQAFINGFVHSMLFVAIETGLGHVQIRPPEYIDTRQPGPRLTNGASVRNALNGKLPADLHVAERIETDAILRIGGDVRGILLIGVDPEKEAGVSGIPSWVYEGDFFKTVPERSLGRGCLLGKKSADEYELETGDWIVITTGQPNSGSVSFRCIITGLFHSPSSVMDESLVLMRKEDVSMLRYGNPDETSYFVFLGGDYKRAGEMKRTILSLLPEKDRVGVYTYSELEPFIQSYFELTDQFTWIVYMIILMGFGIVLFESVTMSIFERIHEIGIIHALGTGPNFLFWLVMVEAFLLTMVGSLISLVPGLSLTGFFYYTGVNFEEITLSGMAWGGNPGLVRPYVTVTDLLTGLAIAIVVSFFSGIYPALKAVRMPVLKAIYDR